MKPRFNCRIGLQHEYPSDFNDVVLDRSFTGPLSKILIEKGFKIHWVNELTDLQHTVKADARAARSKGVDPAWIRYNLINNDPSEVEFALTAVTVRSGWLFANGESYLEVGIAQVNSDLDDLDLPHKIGGRLAQIQDARGLFLRTFNRVRRKDIVQASLDFARLHFPHCR